MNDDMLTPPHPPHADDDDDEDELMTNMTTWTLTSHPTPQSYSGLRSSRSLDKPIYTCYI